MLDLCRVIGCFSGCSGVDTRVHMLDKGRGKSERQYKENRVTAGRSQRVVFKQRKKSMLRR